MTQSTAERHTDIAVKFLCFRKHEYMITVNYKVAILHYICVNTEISGNREIFIMSTALLWTVLKRRIYYV